MDDPYLTRSLFFGEIAASVSHDLQNVLAIIRESSGLIEDILMMNQDTLKPEEIELLSSNISSVIRQVDRGVSITSGLNNFAHTTESVETANPGKVLERLLSLSKRIFQHKGLDVEIETAETSISIPIDPILFQALAYECIQYSGLFCSGGDVQIASKDQVFIKITTRKTPDAGTTIFSQEDSWLKLSNLAKTANAIVTVLGENQGLHIELGSK